MENLRRLIHESMLPALERCSVILSRFAGIAKFQDTNAAVGFSTQQIGLMMDTIACIHLVCRSILIQVVDELEHFIPFSAWLRYEIERLASDSMSSPDDVTDKEASIDHSKVLLYLSKIMTANPLSIFFADPTSEDENLWAHVEQGVPMFELVNKQLDKQERHVSCTPNLVRVDHLCTHLTQQANSVFAQVAETEKRNVHFGEAQDIGLPQANGPIDMKIGKAV
jgi:anaphase-promoting complex subunit 4